MRPAAHPYDVAKQVILELQLANQALEARGIIGQGRNVCVGRETGTAANVAGTARGLAMDCHRWFLSPKKAKARGWGAHYLAEISAR